MMDTCWQPSRPGLPLPLLGWRHPHEEQGLERWLGVTLWPHYNNHRDPALRMTDKRRYESVDVEAASSLVNSQSHTLLDVR